jgi:hypothetical protein
MRKILLTGVAVLTLAGTANAATPERRSCDAHGPIYARPTLDSLLWLALSGTASVQVDIFDHTRREGDGE